MNEEPVQQPATPQPQPQLENQPLVGQQPTPAPEIASTPSQPLAAQKKGNKKVFIIIGAIIALLAAAIILFFIFLYPRIHAESIASSFMSAIKTNDDDKMNKLSGKGGDALTQRLHDGLSNATYKISSTDKQDNGGFDVHFAITGSPTLNTLTIVVDKDQVTNIVSTSKTAVTDTTTTTAPATNTTKTAVATKAVCLSVADLNSIGFTGFNPITSSGQTLYSFYFQPDSSKYDTTSFNDATSPASVYTKFSDKEFKFSLRGQVNQATSTSGGVQLAQERAAKVQSDLIAAGVPSSRISIDDPIYSSDNSEPQIFRTVTLFLSCSL